MNIAQLIKRTVKEAAITVRGALLKMLVKDMGHGVRVYSWPDVYYPDRVSIGNDVTLNPGILIEARGGVRIGNNVRISPFVVLETSYLEFHHKEREHACAEIVIEDDVWIATRATILSGVTVGKGSVIAAGAVVTKNVPPGHVAKGVPARFEPIQLTNG